MEHDFELASYGPRVVELMAGERVPELGPGSPNTVIRPLLQALTVEQLFEGRTIVDAAMARCCLAALWLHHDFLDESHAISQEIGTPEGSYWHGIMHRREPDAANARYWFRRVAPHPVIDQLVQARAFENPFAFIDECERVRGAGSDDESRARRVQLLEFRVLFDYCHRGAVG